MGDLILAVTESPFTNSYLADFVGGFWDNYYQNSNAVYGIRTGSIGLYAQDTFKVTARLTLNYGLRWDYYVPQYDIHNEILGLFPGQQSTVFPNAPLGILYPGDPGTPNRALVYPDYNNFAPRFGFAWDMLGTGKIVMRGGFGIFYDIEDGALNLQFGGLPPFAGVANEYNSGSSFAGPGGDPIADPFGTFGATNVFPFLPADVGTFDVPAISYGYTTYPHFRTPYSENFNFGFQWQATKDTMVEAVYVGSLGRKLISTAETNYPDPSDEKWNSSTISDSSMKTAPGRWLLAWEARTTQTDPLDPTASPTGVTQIYTNFSNGLSDSDEFQLTVDKRFSQGFALRAAYTVGKVIDLSSGFRSRSSTYTDPLDPSLDRAVADFDVAQRLVISGIWQLPLDRHFDNGFMKKLTSGWQFNGIATFQGGQPVYVVLQYQFQPARKWSGPSHVVIGPIQYLNPRSTTTSFDSSTATVLRAGQQLATSGSIHQSRITPPRAEQTPTDHLTQQGVPLFTFGTMPRNVLRGPGINNSIFR